MFQYADADERRRFNSIATKSNFIRRPPINRNELSRLYVPLVFVKAVSQHPPTRPAVFF
jgi:hypothetical protein